MFNQLHLISISFIIKIQTATELVSVSQKFSIQKDTSINGSLNQSWLIENYKINSKLKCLAHCNLITSCSSVTFNTDPSSINNCALYSKVFLSSELVSLKDTNLYFKAQCKINILIRFILILILL